MYSEKPLAILIMPPINQTTNVDAKEYFHSTLLHPLAEAGYYVIPPFLSMEILKKESAYDSEQFLEKPLKLFGEVFGADVALFTVIHKWDKNPIAATVTVDIEYVIRSTKTDEVLYSRRGTVIYDNSTSNNNGGLGGLVASMAISALKTATQDYMPVAISCNKFTFYDLPQGNYSAKHGNDGEELQGNNHFKVRLH